MVNGNTMEDEQLTIVFKLQDLLHSYHPVKQQMVIELLMAAHAANIPGHEKFIIDSMAKHAKQLLEGREV